MSYGLNFQRKASKFALGSSWRALAGSAVYAGLFEGSQEAFSLALGSLFAGSVFSARSSSKVRGVSDFNEVTERADDLDKLFDLYGITKERLYDI